MKKEEGLEKLFGKGTDYEAPQITLYAIVFLFLWSFTINIFPKPIFYIVFLIISIFGIYGLKLKNKKGVSQKC
jgi:hypothetical protein